MSGWDRERPAWRRALPGAAAVLLLLALLLLPRALEDRASAESLRLAGDQLRRAAVQCYALEGAYPPSLDYLAAHYGVEIDESRYFVDYQYIASNLMPDITVLPAL